MSAGLEKTESQLERAYGELEAIRERKADILEKEKIAMARVTDLENQRILQIVDICNLNGDDLKKKLAALMPANNPKPAPVVLKPNDERKNENEENK